MCLGHALWQSSRLCKADNERCGSLRLDTCRGNALRRCPPDSIPPTPEQPVLRWRQSEPSVPPHAALAFGQSAGSSCHARQTLTRFSGSSPRLSARAAPVESRLITGTFGSVAGRFFQRLLNPRRGAIGVSGGSRRFCLSNVAWRTEQTAHAELAPCQLAERTDQDVLKRCRLIPSFLIFDSTVCLGMPSLAAPPPGPPMTPPASRTPSPIPSPSCPT